MNQTGVKLNFKMSWHESWITKIAFSTFLVLLLSLATSGYMLYKSIQAITQLAYDKNVENVLGEHLDSIKQVHELQQALIVESIKPNSTWWLKEYNVNPTEKMVKSWLKTDEIGDITDIDKIIIRDIGKKFSEIDKENPVFWLDRSNLQLLNFKLTFPKGDTYKKFKSAEDTRQRYQLVGTRLDEDIKPRLIEINTIVLLVSFLLLASLFWIVAKGYKRSLEQVLDGFGHWSAANPKFRFAPGYKGELKLITSQFNAMADDVDANRSRNLYLEKIASWQIIARKLAHEIKNPLTPIQMMVSQLKRKYTGNDENFRDLLDKAQKIITEEVAGLRRMVDNFSEFAQLPQASPENKDLVSICSHIVELQKPAYPELTIQFSSPFPELNALVDEDLIRQVLLNLIKNAAEACLSATGSTITVSLRDMGSYASIEIQDDGPGIPKEMQERVFEAYFTTKHTGPTPGMGLGLAVCQKIILDHAGKLTVRSAPGQTIFQIQIPKP